MLRVLQGTLQQRFLRARAGCAAVKVVWSYSSQNSRQSKGHCWLARGALRGACIAGHGAAALSEHTCRVRGFEGRKNLLITAADVQMHIAAPLTEVEVPPAAAAASFDQAAGGASGAGCGTVGAVPRFPLATIALKPGLWILAIAMKPGPWLRLLLRSAGFDIVQLLPCSCWALSSVDLAKLPLPEIWNAWSLAPVRSRRCCACCKARCSSRF